ncbi:MAG: hypothetical protein R3F37_18910, partial [Candidatus Competibacteraceae bacterium]
MNRNLLVAAVVFLTSCFFIKANATLPDFDFVDEFNTLDSSSWEIISGSWSINNGKLKGYWSQSQAQTDHANYLLRSTPDRYFAEFVYTSQSGNPRFSVYNSPGNKYEVIFSDSQYTVVKRQNNSKYSFVIPWTDFPPGMSCNSYCQAQLA